MTTASVTAATNNVHKLGQYFLDLDLSGTAFYGPNRILRRNLWLVACYLAFGMGVFARQIVTYGDTGIYIQKANINFSSFFGALVVGLALYPFALRTIIRLVTSIFSSKELRAVQGFNMVHLMASFSLGYFFNSVAQNIPAILVKLGI